MEIKISTNDMMPETIKLHKIILINVPNKYFFIFATKLFFINKLSLDAISNVKDLSFWNDLERMQICRAPFHSPPHL